MRRHVEDVFVADAVRTPIGRLGGALAATRPDDLAAIALRELVGRSQGLDAADFDEVYLGNANGAGEDNRNVARMAALLAGFPTTVPGSSVNRLCGSGMEAVIAASRALAVGDADVVVAGGVESMSRAPWVLQKPERAFPTANQTVWNSALGWRMVNPAMPAEWTVSLGSGAQALACLADWPDLDRSIVNPVGGAIAVGHPLGCSGARILTTLVHHLVRTGGRYGLAAMCIGVGQGIAVIVENVGSGSLGRERVGTNP
ncbi:MAG: beta-ketoacyl synthase N-terminal-like domain-containing protein [bacterium]|nr:beta-ketoacyl synthase N-terminal-like domain-containing protein [bacterium]